MAQHKRYRIKSSLQESRGYWYVQSRVYDIDTGQVFQRRRSTSLKVAKNKRRAAAMIPEIESKVMQEFDRPSIKDEPLFQTYCSLRIQKRGKAVSEATVYAYQLYADKHILPALGDVPVRELTYRMIQDFYDEKSKELKTNSLKKLHCVIKGTLDEAVRDGIIISNPSDHVEFQKQNKFRGNAYTVEQMGVLFRAAQKKGEPLMSSVVLAGCYGLRREEVLGLRWKDIDFERGYLDICNTVTRVGGDVVEQERTKTKKSQRRIPLVQSTVPFLETLKQEHTKKRFDLDKVVRWPDGREVNPDYISRAFSKLLEEYHLPHIRFHDLRHTAASLLSAAGVKPKQISEFFGTRKHFNDDGYLRRSL